MKIPAETVETVEMIGSVEMVGTVDTVGEDGAAGPGAAGASGPPVADEPAPEQSAFDVAETESFVTRIYLAMLRQEHSSRALLVAQGIPALMVEECLRILASRRLITVHGDGTWEIHSPEVALQAHAQELESRARAVRASAHELTQVYYHARSGNRAPAEGVRVLQSLDELHTASADLISSGRESVLALRDRSPRTEVLFQAPMSAHRDRILSREGLPLRNRVVFDVQVLDIHNAGEVMGVRAASGERAKVAAGIPFSVVVVDDVGAIVDLSSYEPSGHGSLLVHSRPLVQALTVLAEGFWRRGMPLDRVEQIGLDRRDVAILSLLAAGASDATIARQTRTSQRTVERRVRSLLDRLGAATRFQAGVQAAKHGWL